MATERLEEETSRLREEMRSICQEEIARAKAEIRREIRKELDDIAVRLSAGEFYALATSLEEHARPPMSDPRHTHPEIIKAISQMHTGITRALHELSRRLEL